MSVTYKDIFTLVNDQITKRIEYPTATIYGEGQSSRSQVLSSATMTTFASSDSVQVTNALTELLNSLIPSSIKTGLTVTETDPISGKVKVYAGVGTVGGRIYSLTKDVEIEIPFDSTSSIFFVNLYVNGVEISQTQDANRLVIAKIVVPNPGTTNRVKNKREDDYEWDAYIVNFKEAKFYSDANDKLEEDSIDILKDAIGEILGSTIIGNITINEQLKILNTAGTLELDSSSVKIKDTDGDVLAKFNQYGTFFYDSNGIEVAKFTVDGATVGNIDITKSTIQSGNFVSGALGSGFRIEDSGVGEFQDVIVRGKIISSILEYASTSALGGNFLVSHSADVLNEDMTNSSTSLVTDGDVQFSSSDILWLKDGTNEEYITINSVTSITNYTVTRASGGSAVAWKKGTGIVNLGQSGDGGIFMTASENNSPYISVFTHAGSPWSALTTRLRLGNLNGFLGYSSDKYGIAIGESTKYLKYDPTNGLRIRGTIICESGSTGFTQTFRQSGIPTALNVGDLWIDTDDSKLYRATNIGDDEIIAGEWELQDAALATGWSHASDVTKIDGGEVYTNTITATQINVTNLSAINADLGTITAGTVTGATLRTFASGARVEMDDSGLFLYDSSGMRRFGAFADSLSGDADAGDVIIGNLSNDNYMKWDSSAGTFTVKGAINASSGDFTGTVNVGAAGKVYIDGANEVIKIYDAASHLMVELGKLS